jgi:hypothetical protein
MGLADHRGDKHSAGLQLGTERLCQILVRALKSDLKRFKTFLGFQERFFAVSEIS